MALDKKTQREIEYPLEKITIRDSFEDYTASHKNSFKSLSDKGTRKVAVSSKLYKKIIKRFLTIYVYDLFFLNRSIYFFLGGRMEKARSGGTFRKQKNGSTIVKPKSLGFFWFDRPFNKYQYYTISKLRGKTSALVKIVNEWISENDIDSIQSLRQAYKKHFNYYNHE